MSFEYKENSGRKLSREEKEEFNRAYQRAGERKRREKRNKIFIIILILLIITAGVIFLLK